MALMALSGNAPAGVTGATADGITHITQASVERAAGTTVRAKNSSGDVKAVLIGKETISMNVSGYSTSKDGAALGATITVGGKTGKIIASSIEATAEDFTKFSAQGKALASGGGSGA